jgi:hypothetical protein
MIIAFPPVVEGYKLQVPSSNFISAEHAVLPQRHRWLYTSKCHLHLTCQYSGFHLAPQLASTAGFILDPT